MCFLDYRHFTQSKKWIKSRKEGSKLTIIFWPLWRSITSCTIIQIASFLSMNHIESHNFDHLMTFWNDASIIFCFVLSMWVGSGRHFTFVNNVPDQIWQPFNSKFGPQWKVRKSSYQATYILELFYNSFALILL